MDSFYATVWFFFIAICPTVTVLVVIWAANRCEAPSHAISRAAVVIAGLTLILGPVWTEIGPMPWWFSSSKLVSFEGAHYLIWQYGVLVAVFYLLVWLVAQFLHSRKVVKGDSAQSI